MVAYPAVVCNEVVAASAVAVIAGIADTAVWGLVVVALTIPPFNVTPYTFNLMYICNTTRPVNVSNCAGTTQVRCQHRPRGHGGQSRQQVTSTQRRRYLHDQAIPVKVHLMGLAIVRL